MQALASLAHCGTVEQPFPEQCLLPRDLSENALQAIPRKAFRGATDLKNL